MKLTEIEELKKRFENIKEIREYIEQVQNIINRFNSVVNNDDFLSYISNNAKEWYDRNISNDVIIKTTFNRLDENNI